MQSFVVHRCIKAVGWEPSLRRLNSEFHQALAAFFIPKSSHVYCLVSSKKLLYPTKKNYSNSIKVGYDRVREELLGRGVASVHPVAT